VLMPFIQPELGLSKSNAILRRRITAESAPNGAFRPHRNRALCAAYP
jgi:hypothetical protein